MTKQRSKGEKMKNELILVCHESSKGGYRERAVRLKNMVTFITEFKDVNTQEWRSVNEQTISIEKCVKVVKAWGKRSDE